MDNIQLKIIQMNENIVAFKKGMIIPTNCGQDNRIMVSTLQVQLMQLGYILTEDAFMSLSKADTADIEDWFTDILGYLKEWLDKGKYETIYADFRTVLNTSIEQLFFQQLLTYWTNGQMQFDDDTAKIIKYEEIKWKEIKCGNENDFIHIFHDLAQVNTALTADDFKIVEWFIKDYGSYVMPDSIPFKENLCMIAALGVDVPVKTTTDILRIAFYLSTGKSDLLLPSKKIRGVGYNNWIDNPERIKAKFKLTEAQKRYIMSLLNNMYKVSEMKEKHKMWNKLAHHIHPTRFIQEFPKAVSALRAMSSTNPVFKIVKTYNSQVENASGNVKLHLLKKRPGVLGRKLNELLLSMHTEQVLAAFQECGHKISNKVLFELYTYFEGRSEINHDRKVFIKGNKKPVKLPTLPVLSKDLVENINSTIWEIFKEKFAKLEPMGKVYLDEELRKIPLPTNMKTLEEALTPVIRGQRNPIDLNKRYALLYCCWEGQTDLDFTGSVITKDNQIFKVGYSGLGRSQDKSILFSGDNTGNYSHNSELISIDLENTNAKYILVSVNVYSNRTGTPNGFIGSNATLGIMSRSDVLQSASWKPETIQYAMKPKTNAQQINVFIFDVEAKEWILIDEDAKDQQVSNTTEVLKYITQISELPKLSVYDLLLMHVQARGIQVSDVEEAETILSFDDFSKNYVETIKWML